MGQPSPGLLLGPLLRHVDAHSATIWVETDAPCEVSVLGVTTGTFSVAGHHYALVVLDDLPAAATTAYEVHLSDASGTVRVWPESGSTYPPSRIRTLGRALPFTLVFGSCRYARPATIGEDAGLPPDALDAYAVRMTELDESGWPDALILLGDQVYADETTPHTQAFLANRRDLSQPPGTEVADFEEYTYLYLESWTDPDVRWLMSTIPTSMIFDDHDVRDDWNTSHIWREKMKATSWWQERITGALMSYWIYQHLGNMSPDDLAADPLWRDIRVAGADGGDAAWLLRAFAEHADAEADGAKGTRWSYRRDFGRTRLLMIDSRCGRILADGRRSMIGDAEFEWIESQAAGDLDHLLIGTSLPWLMPYAMHDIEAWNEELCTRYDGRLLGRISERFRQLADLEHWSAFFASFARLGRLIARVGSGADAPATICVLSGDVHHAYVAQAQFPGSIDSQVFQLTCSPLHNTVPGYMRVAFRLGWSRVARLISTRWARLFAVPAPPLSWAKLSGPFFDNQLATLILDGRNAAVRLERAEPLAGGGTRLTLGAAVNLHRAGGANLPHSGGSG